VGLQTNHHSRKQLYRLFWRIYDGELLPAHLIGNITIGEIHTNYATSKKITEWDLGRNMYDNNTRYLIRR